MDTQVNESFNNTVSWFAPKNKVYCGSRSLANRIALAIGINSIGFVAFFTRLYAKLGIEMDASVLYFLKQKDTYRYTRLASLKKASKKKLRMKRKFERLKEDEMAARVQRQKRAGTYRRGMNLDDDEGNGAGSNKKKKDKNIVCPFCKLVGHSTTRSKKCLQNPMHQSLGAQLKDEAGGDPEQDKAQDNDDLDLFYDVGTWSDNEDEEQEGLMSCIL